MAIVWPLLAKHSRWLIESIPLAKPDTILTLQAISRTIFFCHMFTIVSKISSQSPRHFLYNLILI